MICALWVVVILGMLSILFLANTNVKKGVPECPRWMKYLVCFVVVFLTMTFQASLVLLTVKIYLG